MEVAQLVNKKKKKSLVKQLQSKADPAAAFNKTAEKRQSIDNQRQSIAPPTPEPVPDAPREKEFEERGATLIRDADTGQVKGIKRADGTVITASEARASQFNKLGEIDARHTGIPTRNEDEFRESKRQFEQERLEAEQLEQGILEGQEKTAEAAPPFRDLDIADVNFGGITDAPIVAPIFAPLARFFVGKLKQDLTQEQIDKLDPELRKFVNSLPEGEYSKQDEAGLVAEIFKGSSLLSFAGVRFNEPFNNFKDVRKDIKSQAMAVPMIISMLRERSISPQTALRQLQQRKEIIFAAYRRAHYLASISADIEFAGDYINLVENELNKTEIYLWRLEGTINQVIATGNYELLPSQEEMISDIQMQVMESELN